ncbi:MAG: AAA family ATPase [bacterium]
MIYLLRMVRRTFWIDRIQKLWKRRSIIWLSGVRRIGKTFLCKSLSNILYFDCELPRTRRLFDDPEDFLANHKNKTLIIDEIHRLDNPSELLKIAADYYPKTKIIATGSSTLGASSKFKDTLAGRKTELWLTPAILQDMADFEKTDIKKRLLKGGMPQALLTKAKWEKEYSEWMDAFWAKDIQELFRLERRHSFLKFIELLFVNSGSMFEATKYSTPCEISRTTIHNYLSVLESTFVFHVIRPFNTHRANEIISAPKVYGFDTGFVCFYKGWDALRLDDLGYLWEHFVLNELHANIQTRQILYWRDKRDHEIDYILRSKTKGTIAIECKWSSHSFSWKNLESFRQQYPKGLNYVVSQDIDEPYSRTVNKNTAHFVNPNDLITQLKKSKI